jgi:hypothetical protein
VSELKGQNVIRLTIGLPPALIFGCFFELTTTN